MNTIPYYFTHVFPIVLALAAIFFLLGTTVGWLLWRGTAERLRLVESENHRLLTEVEAIESGR